MDWTREEIIEKGFLDFEELRESRKLNGYTLFSIHASLHLKQMEFVDRVAMDIKYLTIDKENEVVLTNGSPKDISQFGKNQKCTSGL